MSRQRARSGQGRRGTSLRSFLSFSKPHAGKIVFVLALFIVADVFLAVIPLFIGKLTDTIVHKPILTSDAWRYAIILIACSSIHNLTWRAAEFSYRQYILPIGYLYETFLFKRIIAEPYHYFVDKFTGKVASYITTLSQEFRNLLDALCFAYTGQIISLVAMFFILLSVNWQTGAIYLAGLLGMLLLGRITLKKDMLYRAKETDISATKSGHIIDTLANFMSVKAFQTEAVEIGKVSTLQATTISAAKQANLWSIIFWASMSLFIRDLMWPAVIILNVYYVLHGHISIGQFTTVLSTALIFTSTVWEAVWHASVFGEKLARTDEAHEYLFGRKNVQPTSLEAKRPMFLPEQSFSIRNLTFAYPDKPDVTVLHDCTIVMNKGEKVGIVGRSGSGKSTLTKLLLDYYEVKNDVFYFDDRAVPGETVARNIAFVPQDTTLFHRSISDNIAYGAGREVTREEVMQAARQAEADEFIGKLAEGYDTLVGERGVKLSGGQRQRIAIARAILRNAPILVLDEATSALDSESEKHIQKALENMWHDKTFIAIAHRLSTLRNMDRIIVMDHGRITEQGTHTELLAANGTYAKLWQHQSGGFIDE